MRRQTESLWRDNAAAWKIYQTLCGRTVGLCELRGYVLERLTETWPTEALLELLARLDLMLEVLEPKRSAHESRI